MIKERLPDSKHVHFPITEALSAIRDNINGERLSSATAASSLASVCSDFNFIVPLVIVANCLAYVKPATVKLQAISLIC